MTFSLTVDVYLAQTTTNVLLDVLNGDDTNSTQFGQSIKIHKNRIIIGVPYGYDDYYYFTPGSAYIFELSTSDDHQASKWTQIAKLTPDDPSNDDFFGQSVDIYDNFAIVGSNNNRSKLGSAYIFEHNPSSDTWSQTTKLVADNRQSYDYFGSSVALSYNRAIVGCRNDDDIGYNSGSAYIFDYNNTTKTWSQNIKLIASDASSSDSFGELVAINQHFAAVSAPDVDTVYIFKYISENNTWYEMTKLVSNNSDEYFGESIGLSRDGYRDLIIVGAPYCNKDKGCAYIFEYDNSNDTWNFETILTANDGMEDDNFGYAVAISDDFAIVSNEEDNSANTNMPSVYIFQRNNSNGTISTWSEITKVISGNTSGRRRFCRFGCELGIDNTWIVIGGRGEAFIYDLNDTHTMVLDLNYDYETAISILGIDNTDDWDTTVNIGDSGVNYYVSACDSESSWDVNDISNWKYKGFYNGCMDIIFSDCDDSLTNDRTEKHGSYTIGIDDNIVGYGGYYNTLESHTVCANKNHISYCIVPKFCSDNNNLWAFDSSDILSITSYKSIVNSSLYFLWLTDEWYLYIDCNGDRSCSKSLFRDEYRIVVLRCTGVYSCDESRVETSYPFITCIGLKSCNNVFENSGGYSWSRVYLYGPMAGVAMQFYDIGQTYIYTQTQLALANDVVSLAAYPESYPYLGLTMKSDFSLWNVTITCNQGNISNNTYFSCDMECTNENSTQFIIIDDSCGGSLQQCNIDNNCSIVEKIDDIDSETIETVQTVIDLIKEFETVYGMECSDNITTNDALIFDVGYPLYGESFITNEKYRSGICCRGSESCAYSNSLFSNLGNIFCSGDFSCGESAYIWTSETVEEDEIPSLQVTIYCMGYSACAKSSLKSSNAIVCGAYSSCYNAQIAGAQTLHCTDSACDRAIISQVETVYILGTQSQMVYYSGGVGETTIYLRGRNAATDLTLTCTEGDVCNINCGKNACDKNDTLLTCHGKCFVQCPNDFYINSNTSGDYNIYCANILISASPTVSPTTAPTINPTIGPTNAPTNDPTMNPTESPSVPPTNAPTSYPTVPPTISNALTRDDVGIWFNWVLWVISGCVIVVVIIGCLDSQKFRQNELFRWNSIVLFGFYSIDFVSDVFLSIELFFNMVDDDEEFVKYRVVYVILFISSIIFIIVPLITTLVQLHRELTKWLMDPILARTDAPLWIINYLRILYLVAIISGSSFSAVSLFNSNLFKWPMFSMGLARFHRRIFRTKRFFSVVLLEVCCVFTIYTVYNFNFWYILLQFL